MYANPKNRVNDQADAADFVVAHPFAVLARNGENGPIVAHVPLVAVRDEAGNLVELIGHVARANPFHEGIGEEGAAVVAVFRGADAYVSPSLYPTKALTGKVVPTWNYLAAEARGTIFVDREPANMKDYLVALTNEMESHRALPWAVTDAPDDYLASMYRGIVGLRIVVSDLIAKRKLDQTKAVADFQGVANAFAASPNPNEQTLAIEMTKESTTQS
jgi:transcriptional regulator